MAAATNGVDVLVFTGGVGEHQPDIRTDEPKCVRSSCPHGKRWRSPGRSGRWCHEREGTFVPAG
jgi:hypothetical protein